MAVRSIDLAISTSRLTIANAVTAPMPKLAANLSWIYQEVPFLQRFGATLGDLCGGFARLRGGDQGG